MKTSQRLFVRIILFSLALNPWSLGRAQDSSEQVAPPSPPYVAPLTGDFTLVKKFTYASSATGLTDLQKALLAVPTNSKEIDAMKKGVIRKDTELFMDGTSREIWRWESYRFTSYSNFPGGVNLDYTGGPNDSPLLGRFRDGADFPELGWIQGNKFQGIQVRQDKKCYTYKDGDSTAWIDVSTKWPVYFESKIVQVTYTFSDPPDEPLQLPKGYAERLKKFQRALRGQM